MRTIFLNSDTYSPPATPKGILVSVTGRSHSQAPFRGEHWDFRFSGFAYFLDKLRLSAFVPKRLRFFIFGVNRVCCSLRFLFYFALSFRFTAKRKWGYWNGYSMQFSVFPVSRRKICTPTTSTACKCWIFLTVSFSIEIYFSFAVFYYFLYGFAVSNMLPMLHSLSAKGWPYQNNDHKHFFFSLQCYCSICVLVESAFVQ